MFHNTICINAQDISDHPYKDNWAINVDRDGWSVSYPNNWCKSYEQGCLVLIGPGTEPGGKDWRQQLEKGYRAAIITIFDKNTELTPKKYLYERIVSQRKLLKGNDVLVNGLEGYEIIIKDYREWGYPDGNVLREMVLKGPDMSAIIYYGEIYNDHKAIKSDEDWQLDSLFQQIISTFQFNNFNEQEQP